MSSTIKVATPAYALLTQPSVETSIRYTSCIEASITLRLITEANKVIFMEGNTISESAEYVKSVPAGDSIQAQAQVYYGSCLSTFNYKVVVPPLQVPNLVTHNGDAYNNAFTIKSAASTHHIDIYDRWGHASYSASAYGGEWPKSDTPTGTYYYIIKLGEGESCKGWVEIVR